jgi:hypothetical protein
MGKLSKKNSIKKESFEQKKGLADELESLKYVDESNTNTNTNKQKLKRNRDNVDNDDEFVDSKLSNRILNEARKQQLEFDNEELNNDDNNNSTKKPSLNNNKIKFQLNKKQRTSDEDDDDESEDDGLNEKSEIDYYNQEDIVS